MFDRYDTIYEDVGKERIEKALRKAARERPWEKEPRPALARLVIAQLGGMLVMMGTRLQTEEQNQQVRQRRIT